MEFPEDGSMKPPRGEYALLEVFPFLDKSKADSSMIQSLGFIFFEAQLSTGYSARITI
jgi:hypothetical protein